LDGELDEQTGTETRGNFYIPEGAERIASQQGTQSFYNFRGLAVGEPNLGPYAL